MLCKHTQARDACIYKRTRRINIQTRTLSMHVVSITSNATITSNLQVSFLEKCKRCGAFKASLLLHNSVQPKKKRKFGGGTINLSTNGTGSVSESIHSNHTSAKNTHYTFKVRIQLLCIYLYHYNHGTIQSYRSLFISLHQYLLSFFNQKCLIQQIVIQVRNLFPLSPSENTDLFLFL